ncbi:MAG TPA: hypothetical protein PLT69_07410, partial [Deltaproteobacteria bacterium]|nr:hypothetical protein [Deltaproteobacteria bacterium]
MRKLLILALASLSAVLWAYGCGGGGSGGGSSGSGDGYAIEALAYLTRDTSRTYTFTERVEASWDDQRASEEHEKTFSYETVDAIPGVYGDFSAYQGPFTKETVRIDGVETMVTYTDGSGNVIVSDDFSVFTSITGSTSSGTLPTSMVPGTAYTTTLRELLYNSDASAGAFGVNTGSSVTTTTFTPVAVGTITLGGTPYRALEAKISLVVSINGTVTTTTEYTGRQWFGEGLGLIKAVLSYEVQQSGITVEYTVTDELVSVE